LGLRTVNRQPSSRQQHMENSLTAGWLSPRVLLDEYGWSRAALGPRRKLTLATFPC
jgi:hypothetical protein